MQIMYPCHAPVLTKFFNKNLVKAFEELGQSGGVARVDQNRKQLQSFERDNHQAPRQAILHTVPNETQRGIKHVASDASHTSPRA